MMSMPPNAWAYSSEFNIPIDSSRSVCKGFRFCKMAASAPILRVTACHLQ